MNNNQKILAKIKEAAKSLYPNADLSGLLTEKPKNEAMGDAAAPFFSLAKTLKLPPNQIAQAVAEKLAQQHPDIKAQAAGAYLNVFLNREEAMKEILGNVLKNPESYGSNGALRGSKIMIEFSGPNTNKPLHLGHLRNNALGESVSRLMKNAGAEVYKVNIINNRGVHICKSMLAYQKFGNGKTPESEGLKSDHFVGDYYVRYTAWAKENADAERQIQEMLKAWEDGDPNVQALWKLMNDWAVNGIEETYKKTGISFDKAYYESDTYKLGKDIVMQGLSQGVFFKAEDGSIRLDLSELDKNDKEKENISKVFLRADGTGVYITQDLGTAVERHNDFPFDRLIYVVASEQQRHFQVLFYALMKMGYPWAKNLYHLSYGMVNLPEGKMKSREGTVVDADDLLESLEQMALAEIKEKGRLGDVEQNTAFKVGLGALHYYLLQVSPNKDMLFNAKESLSFNGDTGPYLQYAAARIASMARRPEAAGLIGKPFDVSLLAGDEEWKLCRLVEEFPEVLARSAKEFSPNLTANYLYSLAKAFNKYYHETPILAAKEKALAGARLQLALAVGSALKNGMEMLNIPYMEKM